MSWHLRIAGDVFWDDLLLHFFVGFFSGAHERADCRSVIESILDCGDAYYGSQAAPRLRPFGGGHVNAGRGVISGAGKVYEDKLGSADGCYAYASIAILAGDYTAAGGDSRVGRNSFAGFDASVSGDPRRSRDVVFGNRLVAGSNAQLGADVSITFV